MTILVSPHRRRAAVVAAFVSVALILPVVITALMLWSFLGRSSSLSSIPVAVVNDDDAVTVGEGDSAKTVAAGRQLAANLTSPAAPGQYQLNWVLTDAQDAADGLAAGRFAAVMTIPATFSAAITSTSTTTPTQAKITVQSNDSSNRLAGTISEQVAAAAADDLGAQASASYLNNLFLGFNTIAEQMSSAAGSASELSTGAGQVASSSTSVDAGAQSLDQSMGDLVLGAANVASGAAALASASAAVADGASRTADGASEAATATAAVARGSAAAREGAERLSAAATALADSASSLADACPESAGVAYCAHVRELAGRARAQEAATGGLARVQGDLSNGATGAAGASQAVSDGTGSVAAGSGSLAENSAALADGAAAMSTGTRSADDGAAQLAAGTAALTAGAASVSSGSQTLASSLASGAQSVPTYTDAESETLQTVVTEPVVVDSQRTNATGIQAWPAALVAATVLWLGAIAASYLRRGLFSTSGAVSPRSAVRAAAGTLTPVFAATVIQAVAVWIITICFGLPAAAATTVAAFTLLAAVTFTGIIVALRTLLPRYGSVAALVAFAVQLVCASGLLPLQAAPASLQALNPLLPFTAFTNALAGSISGVPAGSLLLSAAVLLGWTVAAVAVAVVAERRGTMRGASFPTGMPVTWAIEAPTRRALGTA